MSAPDFPPGTLDDEGCPLWLAELTGDDPHFALHVASELDPAAALEALGARPAHFRPAVLPPSRPGDGARGSLVDQLGIPADAGARLLAGRVAGWTFVVNEGFYDSHGATALSAGGRTAATSTMSINTDTSLTYAVDGTDLVRADGDSLDLTTDLAGMPAELRAAFATAGVVRYEDEPDLPDLDVLMRTACALAGLVFPPDELRRLPLLCAPLG